MDIDIYWLKDAQTYQYFGAVGEEVANINSFENHMFRFVYGESSQVYSVTEEDSQVLFVGFDPEAGVIIEKNGQVLAQQDQGCSVPIESAFRPPVGLYRGSPFFPFEKYYKPDIVGTNMQVSLLSKFHLFDDKVGF